jgi:hypothetical protein
MKPDALSVARDFEIAYLLAWNAANTGKHDFLGRWRDSKDIVEKDAQHHLRFFVSCSDAQAAKVHLSDIRGLYIVPSRLDDAVLHDMGLPKWPKELRSLVQIVQIEKWSKSLAKEIGSRTWTALIEPSNTIAEPHKEIEQIANAQKLDSGSLAWRAAFMKKYPSFTSAEVASEALSGAKNQASVAYRWSTEGKIFSVKFHGGNRYPKFQFRHGEPIPTIATVIRVFGEGRSGWDLAFFFSEANSYLGGRRPMDLVDSDPSRVVSLAGTFVHPADAF